MKKEPIFRGITATLLVAASSISAYHRHKAEREASEEQKISSQEEEGLPTFVALRLSGLTLVFSVLAYILHNQPTLNEVVQP